MGMLYKSTMKAWRGLPAPIKARIYSHPGLIRLLRRIMRPIVRTARHQEIYNAQYYADMDRAAGQAAEVMAATIAAALRPIRLIDAGCGTGALLAAIRAQGINGKGFEYSDAGLDYCRRRNLDVEKFDLLNDSPPPDGKFDVAVSMEVAEHLPESGADRFVELLCALAPVIVFTAARPGQGGRDHINEQPHSYWIEKFAARGFEFDKSTSLQWRADWKSKRIPFWYHQNVMLFKRRESAPDPGA
ncbi:class I SAM-dependent methyltransferase [Candidatus Sumerlaeota bacterium]|nr:class I SAM-dependent methyltransferase [Candidatus Sumerlaeota bacterium]MBI3737132.1 class I SAM-dependent methyltransferase [Candidatus Sumerlaeota bacterium]